MLYLDPDVVVYAPLDDLAALTRTADLVVTPHVTKPMPRDERDVSETHILASGIFNLGFIAVGTCSARFLEYWQERLRRECVIDARNMRFVDQRWVDFAPAMFDVEIVKDPTCNVAYWNLDQRELTWVEGFYYIDGNPLRFFHFSGYRPNRPELLSFHQGSKARVLLSERPALDRICREYGELLLGEGYELLQVASVRVCSTRQWVQARSRIQRCLPPRPTEFESGRSDEPPNPFDHPDAFLRWLDRARARSPARSLPRELLESFGGNEDQVPVGGIP